MGAKTNIAAPKTGARAAGSFLCRVRGAGAKALPYGEGLSPGNADGRNVAQSGSIGDAKSDVGPCKA